MKLGFLNQETKFCNDKLFRILEWKHQGGRVEKAVEEIAHPAVEQTRLIQASQGQILALASR